LLAPASGENGKPATSQVVDPRVPILGGRRGQWAPDDTDWVPAHEAGHLMELGDQYENIGGVSIANSGWGKNIMGERDGAVELRNVIEILNKNMRGSQLESCGCFN
jgi:hypothetical protein